MNLRRAVLYVVFMSLTFALLIVVLVVSGVGIHQPVLAKDIIPVSLVVVVVIPTLCVAFCEWLSRHRPRL